MLPVSQVPPSPELTPDDPYSSLFRPEKSDARTPSDTGRIFKSQGVGGHEEALLAISAQKSNKLRTLSRNPKEQTDVLAVQIPVPDQPLKDPGQSPRVRRRGQSSQRSSGRSSLVDSLRAPWVYAFTIFVTLLFALANVFLFNSQPGTITGIGLLGATLFVSFAVRSPDDIHAIFAPAIAFFIVAITVGQINFLGSGLLSRAIEVFFILGQNWIWIIGSTVVALTIVAFRRRSLR